MRRTPYSAVLLAVLAAACAKSDEKVSDSSAGMMATTTATTTTTAMATPGFPLKDAAGKWTLTARPAVAGKDTTTTVATLNATGDTTGWTMIMGKLKPVPLHVMVKGDSVVATSDKYPSVRRKGLMVTTTSTFHMEGGKLVGTTIAHYAVKTADSVVVLKTEATKAP